MQRSSLLGNLILGHWKKHWPRMVAELMRSNTLEQAVEQAEMRAADLLFEMLSVQKMNYQDAWELAMQDCLLPEEPTSLTSRPSNSRPETSG